MAKTAIIHLQGSEKWRHLAEAYLNTYAKENFAVSGADAKVSLDKDIKMLLKEEKIDPSSLKFERIKKFKNSEVDFVIQMGKVKKMESPYPKAEVLEIKFSEKKNSLEAINELIKKKILKFIGKHLS